MFDLVRGDLATLRASDGDFAAALAAIPSGENACLADDTTALSFPDPYGSPPAGGGFFTLLRPSATVCPAHGTYDDGSSTQTTGRDASLAASPRNCP